MIFDRPEIIDLYFKLLGSIPGESGRGALLVATTYMEDQLTELITSVVPINSNREFKKNLFNFSGLLGTFSSKIDACYAFRLIDKTMYEKLHKLRRLRNDAAHNASKIELYELNDKLKDIYDFGPDIPAFISRVALEALVNDKIEKIKPTFDESSLEYDEKINIIRNLFKEKEDVFSKQAPFWEMVFGLTFMGAIIHHNKDKLVNLIQDVSVWAELGKENTKKNSRNNEGKLES